MNEYFLLSSVIAQNQNYSAVGRNARSVPALIRAANTKVSARRSSVRVDPDGRRERGWFQWDESAPLRSNSVG